MNRSARRYESWMALTVAVAGTVWFGLQVVGFPVPSPWLAALVSYAGLDPFRPTAFPLWGVGMSLLARWIPPAHYVAAANAFSAVCGGISLGLIYATLVSLPFETARQKGRHVVNDVLSRHLAALAGALIAGVATTIFVASTRAGPLSLVLLLAALLLFLARSFRRSGRPGWLWVFSVVYGLALAETPVFLLAAPLVAFWWMRALWQTRQFTVRNLALAALALVPGALLFVGSCLVYYLSPVAEWREFRSLAHVAVFTVRENLHLLAGAAQRPGWLLLLLLAWAPAAAVFSRSFEEEGEHLQRAGRLALRGAILVLLLVHFFEGTGSIASVGSEEAPLVLPALVAALWSGRLCGFVFCWPLLGAGNGARRPLSRWALVARVATLCLLPLALIALGAPRARAHCPAVWADHQAAMREIVESMGGRSWLLTRGGMDPTLQLMAHATGRPLQTINIAAGTSRAYLRYLGDRMEGTISSSLAQVGLQPLLADWLTRGTNAVEQLAVLDDVDVWPVYGHGYGVNGCVYIGQAAGAATGPAPALAALERLRARAAAWPTSRHPIVSAALRSEALRLSKLAVNLGVVLEESGRADAAGEAYDAALRWNTNNVSAALNRAALPAEGDAGRARLLAQATNYLAAAGAVALGQRDGYVRQLKPYLDQGWLWVLNARRPGAAGALAPGEVIDVFGPEQALGLAWMALRRGDLDGAEGIYRDVLRRQPSQRLAVHGLVRVALARKDWAAAERGLAQLELLGASAGESRSERAALALGKGEFAQAEPLVREALRFAPKDPNLWVQLARIGEGLGQTKLVDEALVALQGATTHASACLYLAQSAQKEGAYPRAREWLLRAGRAGAAEVVVLEGLLSLDLLEQDTVAARTHATVLVRAQPGHVLANYAMAGLYVEEGQYDLAEECLQRSIATQPTPYAWADLARLFNRRGAPERALDAAEQAIQLSEQQASAWEAKGRALLQLARNDEARAALQKALSLEDTASTRLALASACVRTEQYDEARTQLQAVVGLYEGHLSRTETTEFQELNALLAPP